VSYVSRSKLKGHGLVGQLISMTRLLDLHSYQEQQIVNTKRSQKMIVRFVPKSEVMFFEFEGFGDLLGQEATLCYGNHAIASGLIGIDNDVTLYYQNPLPRVGMAITVAAPD
jgi:hypothetical protein